MAQSPLGEFEVLVLMAVMRLADDANGSRVHGEIQQRANRRVARGAVYMTLDRLETKKLLVSRVVAATADRAGRAKRLYRTQPAGVRALEQSLTAIARMQAGLNLSVDPIKAR
jgi:DNA-binding PadR family transcriptional regulator